MWMQYIMANLSWSQKESNQEGQWIAVSDLMAGLMMVFLLISVMFMVHVERQREKVAEVVVLYDRLKRELYEDLVTTFASDLDAWGAMITPDLSVRFQRLDALFDEGESRLKPEFKEILNDFFPRYIKILTQSKYRDDILEVRIEGHTSSNWLGADSFEEAYVSNMALSQARTRSALGYVLELNSVKEYQRWMVEHLTANGLSSAKVINTASGEEDFERSRRVEFRVMTHAERRIASLLEELSE